MDWGDTLKTLALSGATTLATALGGPWAGKAVAFVGNKLLGKKDATSEEVKQALDGLSGDQIVALKKLDLDFKAHLAELGVTLQVEELRAERDNTTAVNATMQAEAKAEHWPSYSWRPAIGFAVAFDFFAAGITIMVAYGMAIFGGVPAAVGYLPAMLGALAGLVAASLPILGVASYFRGKAQANPATEFDNKG